MGAAAGQTYDVVVVGGGAAGMSAAKITARMRRSVLVVDAGAPRNAPASGVHNYLYAEDAAPGDLAATGRAAARAYGVEIVEGVATSAAVLEDPEPGQARFSITLDAWGVRVVPGEVVSLETTGGALSGVHLPAGATAGSMVHMDLITEDTGVRVAARAGAGPVGA